MTLAVQALHTASPSLKWYWKNLMRETKSAMLLGISCGALVASIVLIWKGDLFAGITVGASIVLIEMMAAFWGLSIPSLLHRTKLDPKISAGPITLALTDIFTILFYLGMATIIL